MAKANHSSNELHVIFFYFKYALAPCILVPDFHLSLVPSLPLPYSFVLGPLELSLTSKRVYCSLYLRGAIQTLLCSPLVARIGADMAETSK